jgi:hypothetical protein
MKIDKLKKLEAGEVIKAKPKIKYKNAKFNQPIYFKLIPDKILNSIKYLSAKPTGQKKFTTILNYNTIDCKEYLKQFE